MRYWFDTEFHDHGRTIDLISLALVAEDGREWYVVNGDYDTTLAHDWLHQNVIPHIHKGLQAINGLEAASVLPYVQIKAEFLQFVGNDPDPEFWGYYGEYDWVVMRQLFGTLTDWPAGWPLLHMDIEQQRRSLNAPLFPAQAADLHHALADARWTRDCHLLLPSLCAL
jgi:hypothetical protein